MRAGEDAAALAASLRTAVDRERSEDRLNQASKNKTRIFGVRAYSIFCKIQQTAKDKIYHAKKNEFLGAPDRTLGWESFLQNNLGAGSVIYRPFCTRPQIQVCLA
jgi:hypothetical protein